MRWPHWTRRWKKDPKLQNCKATTCLKKRPFNLHHRHLRAWVVNSITRVTFQLFNVKANNLIIIVCSLPPVIALPTHVKNFCTLFWKSARCVSAAFLQLWTTVVWNSTNPAFFQNVDRTVASRFFVMSHDFCRTWADVSFKWGSQAFVKFRLGPLSSRLG